jgi:hypothetical protein
VLFAALSSVKGRHGRSVGPQQTDESRVSQTRHKWGLKSILVGNRPLARRRLISAELTSPEIRDVLCHALSEARESLFWGLPAPAKLLNVRNKLNQTVNKRGLEHATPA